MYQAKKEQVEAKRIDVIEILDNAGGPLSFIEICAECAKNPDDTDAIHLALDELVAQGAVISEPEEGIILYYTPCQPWPNAA